MPPPFISSSILLFQFCRFLLLLVVTRVQKLDSEQDGPKRALFKSALSGLARNRQLRDGGIFFGRSDFPYAELHYFVSSFLHFTAA